MDKKENGTSSMGNELDEICQNGIAASKRCENGWRKIMMDLLYQNFGRGCEMYFVVWMDNPIANEAKVRFVNWLFPEPVMLAALDDLQDTPVEKDKVVMIGPILSDIDDDVMIKLYRVHAIAKKQKAKIIITSPRSIIHSLIPSTTVEEWNDLTSFCYHEIYLRDIVLLNGYLERPKSPKERMGIWKEAFNEYFEAFKLIWIYNNVPYRIVGEFLEKLFPDDDDVKIMTMDKLTEEDDDPLPDNILMVKMSGMIDEGVFAQLTRAADIATEQKKRIVFCSEISIRNAIKKTFSVGKLLELMGRLNEESIEDDLFDYMQQE